MRNLFAALLLIMLVPGAAADDTQLDSRAIATARAYSEALTRGDCASALQLASPALKNRLVAQDKTQAFCDFLSELKQEQVMEEIGAPTAFRTQGRYRIAIIPNVRTSLRPAAQPAYPTESAYVLHSKDDGATWYVLDLSCMDERWLKEVYPPYDGSPPVPRARLKLPNTR
jgi:hypothetical protein